MKKTFIRKGIFACIAAIVGIASSFAQTITTGTVDASVCAGSTISVPFTTTGTVGTDFTVQLSDASGAFTAPVSIGTGTSSPINATIASGTIGGTGYKIRVITTALAILGSESSDVKVKAKPAAPGLPPLSYCVGQSPALVPSVVGSNVKWYLGSDPNTEIPPITSVSTIASKSAAVPFAYVSQTVDGCESDKNLIIMAVYNNGLTPTITNPGDFCQNTSIPADILKSSVKSNEPEASVFTDFRWSDSVNGSFSSTIPVPSTTNVGSKDYFVTSYSYQGCPSPVAKVTVTVKATPAAPAVSNVNYTVGQTASPLTATGTGSFFWFTQESGGAGSTSAPTPSTLAAGTTSYYVTQTVNNCESPRAKVDVVVSAAACTPPPAPSGKSYYSLCVGDAPVKLTADGQNLKWYAYSNGQVYPLTEAPTITTMGSITLPTGPAYYVTQTINGCESARLDIIIVIEFFTPVPVITNPAAVCQNSTISSAILTNAINGYSTTDYTWYENLTDVGTQTVPTPSTAVVGSKDYYVSQHPSHSCPSAKAKITLTVNPTPDAPTVKNISYALGASSVPLTVTAATGTVKWYDTISSTSALTNAPTPSTAAAGTKSYFVSQTVGSCESARAEIVVTVTGGCALAAPTITSSALEYCQFVKAPSLSATAVSGATLNWYGTSATGGSVSAVAPIPSTDSEGTVIYYVGQTLNGCVSPRVAIAVKTNVTPKPVVSTPSVAYCQNAVALPLSATGINLKWYLTIDDSNPRTTALTPYTAKVEDYSFYVTQTGTNNCESEKAEIKVHIKPLPGATITGSTSIAAGATTPVTISFTGDAPWTYTLSNGLSATTANASIQVPVSPAETTTYVITEISNACGKGITNGSAVVTVINCTTPAPTVNTPVNYTVNATSVPLTAIGTALKWYTAATGGTALASAPIPSTTVAGTTSYYVSQTLNNCESPRVELKVVVAGCSTPAPAVSSPVNYTIGAPAIALTATGTSLKWYSVAVGGTASTSAPIPSTSVAGTTSYFVSQTINNCEGPRSEIVVSVASCATALPIVVNPPAYCFNSTAPPLTASGTGLKWYTLASGGTALASAPIPNTQVAGPISYFVSQTLNGCEGPRAEIKITVTAETPKPEVSATLNYCFGETASVLTATGVALKWYNTAGTNLATAPTPDTKIAGPISYFVTQTLNNCESVKAEIKVTVNPVTLAPTVANPTVTYCFNQAPVILGATGTGLKWYTAATGGAALASGPTPTTTVAATTSYFVSQTLNNCESVRTEIKVVVSAPVAVPGVSSSPLIYCQSENAPALLATSLSGATLLWYGIDATGGTESSTAPIPSTVSKGTISYYVAQKDASGCVSSRAKIDVTTNVADKPIVATPSVAYCQNATATTLSATGTNLKWYLTSDDPSPRTTPLTPYTAKVEDYSFYVTQTQAFGNKSCESAKAEIKVHIKPLPSATISGNSSIPLGGTANVTINFTGDAPWSYILSNGSSAATSSATLSIPVSPTVTTTYVVTEVSNSCGKGIINGSALVTVQIPTLTIGVPSVSESCAGKTFTVQFQQSGSFPDGSTMKAQISTVNETSKFISIPSVISGNVITATIPDTTVKGTYYIRIANIGKDGSLIAAGNVSSGQITVNPLPVATISGATTIYMGATANLKVDLTGNAPWTFSLNNGLTDSLVSTSVNPIIVKVIPKATTTYTISKVSNQCGTGRGAGSARIQVDPVLGTEPPVVSGDWLKIYPTLVDSKCTVEITSAVSAKEAEVEILDLNGRSLYKRSINQKITEVDFSQRPAGLYLLKVQNGKYNSVQRILKP